MCLLNQHGIYSYFINRLLIKILCALRTTVLCPCYLSILTCFFFSTEGIPQDTLSTPHTALFIFMVAVASVGIVFSIFCIVFNFAFRNKRWSYIL